MGEKAKHFVLIRGLYDTLDLFSEELEAALKRLGHSVYVLNAVAMERQLPGLLELAATKGVDCVIAFNNLAYNLGTKEGGNLWDAMSVPYVDILMDHPFHFDRALQNMPADAHLFVVDRNHVDYVKKYYTNIKRVSFLPHGGCANAISSLPDAPRDIDVLYAGALSRVLIEQLIPDFDAITAFDGAAFSGRCLDRLISEPDLTTEEVIRQELAEEGLAGLSPEEERQYITDFRFLDGFAVSFYRENAVRNLVEHGIDVTTLGVGWEQCEWADNPHLHIAEKVSAKEVFSYMRRAKVVLSTQTWFKAGAHDRIFNGMLSGAAVVTDTSTYLQEALNSTQCVLYNLTETGRLYERVSALLNADGARRELAAAGQAAAAANHTWENRADELLTELADAGV